MHSSYKTRPKLGVLIERLNEGVPFVFSAARNKQ